MSTAEGERGSALDPLRAAESPPTLTFTPAPPTRPRAPRRLRAARSLLGSTRSALLTGAAASTGVARLDGEAPGRWGATLLSVGSQAASGELPGRSSGRGRLRAARALLSARLQPPLLAELDAEMTTLRTVDTTAGATEGAAAPRVGGLTGPNDARPRSAAESSRAQAALRGLAHPAQAASTTSAPPAARARPDLASGAERAQNDGAAPFVSPDDRRAQNDARQNDGAAPFVSPDDRRAQDDARLSDGAAPFVSPDDRRAQDDERDGDRASRPNDGARASGSSAVERGGAAQATRHTAPPTHRRDDPRPTAQDTTVTPPAARSPMDAPRLDGEGSADDATTRPSTSPLSARPITPSALAAGDALLSATPQATTSTPAAGEPPSNAAPALSTSARPADDALANTPTLTTTSAPATGERSSHSAPALTPKAQPAGDALANTPTLTTTSAPAAGERSSHSAPALSPSAQPTGDALLSPTPNATTSAPAAGEPTSNDAPALTPSAQPTGDALLSATPKATTSAPTAGEPPSNDAPALTTSPWLTDDPQGLPGGDPRALTQASVPRGATQRAQRLTARWLKGGLHAPRGPRHLGLRPSSALLTARLSAPAEVTPDAELIPLRAAGLAAEGSLLLRSPPSGLTPTRPLDPERPARAPRLQAPSGQAEGPRAVAPIPQPRGGEAGLSTPNPTTQGQPRPHDGGHDLRGDDDARQEERGRPDGAQRADGTEAARRLDAQRPQGGAQRADGTEARRLDAPGPPGGPPGANADAVVPTPSTPGEPRLARANDGRPLDTSDTDLSPRRAGAASTLGEPQRPLDTSDTDLSPRRAGANTTRGEPQRPLDTPDTDLNPRRALAAPLLGGLYRARAIDAVIRALQAVPGPRAALTLRPALAALALARTTRHPAALRAAFAQLTSALAAPDAPHAALRGALHALAGVQRADLGLTARGGARQGAWLTAPPLRAPASFTAEGEPVGLRSTTDANHAAVQRADLGLTAAPLRAPASFTAEGEPVGLRADLGLTARGGARPGARLTAPPLRAPASFTAEGEAVGLRPGLGLTARGGARLGALLTAPPLRAPASFTAEGEPVGLRAAPNTALPATATGVQRADLGLTAPPLRAPASFTAEGEPVGLRAASNTALPATATGVQRADLGLTARGGERLGARLTAPPLRASASFTAEGEPVGLRAAPNTALTATATGVQRADLGLTAPPLRASASFTAEGEPVGLRTDLGLTARGGARLGARLTAPPLRAPVSFTAEGEPVGLRAPKRDHGALDAALDALRDSAPRVSPGASTPQTARAQVEARAWPTLQAALRAVVALRAQGEASPALDVIVRALQTASHTLLSAGPSRAVGAIDLAIGALGALPSSADEAPRRAVISALRLTNGALARAGHPRPAPSPLALRRTPVYAPAEAPPSARPAPPSLRVGRGPRRLTAPRPGPPLALDLAAVITALEGVVRRGGQDAAPLTASLTALRQTLTRPELADPSAARAALADPVQATLTRLLALQRPGADPLGVAPLILRLARLQDPRTTTSSNSRVVYADLTPTSRSLTLLKPAGGVFSRPQVTKKLNQAVDMPSAAGAQAVGGAQAPIQRRLSGNLALGGVAPVVLSPPKVSPAAATSPADAPPPTRWTAPAAATPSPPSWAAAADPRSVGEGPRAAEPVAEPAAEAPPPSLPSTEAELLSTLRLLARGSAEARGLLREIQRAMDEQARLSQWRRL